MVAVAVGYFFYGARGVIFNPGLEIFEPRDGAVINSSRLHIAGRTEPLFKVWISGREAQADESGIFEDNIPVWPGYNQIGISVRDKFGNETRKILRVVVE
ncbi:MAG: Fibronectin type III domain protein [Candidatus Giovannonibacteria bacterium GW2011_GWB1_46_20]|nr:MAG: Fibronectin type III domain protein [Parcubacteria group bacterium GW2011_GWC1_44_10]KKT60286.1 MAG: Fibronectin type III domain protein [Candidatus Giovannonibacteria bacterium GW2011_GWA1_44_25]KKU29686.1 MAG: Fibronectin type III domain protein [Candidatus Giovannonibacteria bacterium GW2011_GWB1_46_20]